MKEKVERLARPGDRISEAVTAAKEAGIAIVCIGLDERYEGCLLYTSQGSGNQGSGQSGSASGDSGKASAAQETASKPKYFSIAILFNIL